MKYIYALADPRTENVRYVGKARNPQVRLSNHLARANGTQSRHVSRWLKSLKDLGLRPILIILEEIPDDQDWQARERYWIAFYREAAKSQGTDLTNYTDGGDGGATRHGHKMSPEHKANLARLTSQRLKGSSIPWLNTPSSIAKRRESLKAAHARRRLAGTSSWGHHSDDAKARMSAAKKGKPLSEEHKQKLSVAKKNKKQSEEFIEKRVAPLRGRTQSPELRAKWAEARREWWKRKREKTQDDDVQNK